MNNDDNDMKKKYLNLIFKNKLLDENRCINCENEICLTFFFIFQYINHHIIKVNRRS